MKLKEKHEIKKQLYEASLRQGDESEQFVIGLLEEYSSLNKLPIWILGWNHHDKWSFHDINGIDITIYTDSGEIYIDVKSSHLFLRNFKRLHGDKGILVFVLDKSESRGAAFYRLYHMLKKKYSEMTGIV